MLSRLSSSSNYTTGNAGPGENHRKVYETETHGTRAPKSSQSSWPK